MKPLNPIPKADAWKRFGALAPGTSTAPGRIRRSISRRIRYERLSQARGAVVRFLKKNPFSTDYEIFKATGVHIGSVLKKGMFKNKIYDGKKCWRVVANPEQLL
jgi:hypothetical protein